MDSLPDELLRSVFQWLPFNTLVTVLSLVCSRWKRVSRDQEFFKVIDFKWLFRSADYVNSLSSFEKFLESCSCLKPREIIITFPKRQISFRDPDARIKEAKIKMEEIFVKNTFKWENLQVVKLENCFLNEEIVTKVLSSINYVNLREFSNSNSDCFTSQMLQMICTRFVNLVKLDISLKLQVSPVEHLKWVAESDLRQLRHLMVELDYVTNNYNLFCVINRYHLQLESLTIKFSRIKSVSLTKDQVSDDIYKLIGKCSILKNLSLLVDMDQHLVPLCSSIGSLQHLQVLHIKFRCRKAREEISLAELAPLGINFIPGFRGLSSLRDVRLDDVYTLTDAELSSLCSGSSQTLCSLRIIGAPFVTGAFLLDLLTCDNLQELWLCYCRSVSEQGMNFLDALFHNHDVLRHLGKVFMFCNNLEACWMDSSPVFTETLCRENRPEVDLEIRKGKIY